MKNNTLILLVALIAIGTLLLGQSYPYPTYQSGHDIAEWNMRGGHIASGSFTPSAVASEGALFYDVSTPTTPLLYRYSGSAWAIAGGSGGGSGGGGGTATITTAIEANAASITLNIASISANASDISTNASDLSAHEATQTDPHGATMTVTQSVTIGNGTPDAYVEYNGTGTVLISSYTQIPFDATEPDTISSDAVTLWAYPASNTLRLHDGLEWQEISVSEEVGVFAYLTTASTTICTTGGTWYPINGTFSNVPSCCFTASTTPSLVYTGTKTRYFEIDWMATVAGDVNGITMNGGISKNGTIIASSVMGNYLKTSGESFAISGTCVVSLAPNDYVQLVARTIASGKVLTFRYYTTTIRPFTH